MKTIKEYRILSEERYYVLKKSSFSEREAADVYGIL